MNKVMSFRLYLQESSSKNVHLEHLEDAVLNDGVTGGRDAINFLQSLRDMLAGHSPTRKINLTTKWDGCVHEDTIILTNLGEMTIKQIVDQKHLWPELQIMGKNLSSTLQEDKLSPLFDGMSCNGNKNWIEIVLENGQSIKLTEDHEVHTKNRGWIKAGELTKDDDLTEL